MWHRTNQLSCLSFVGKLTIRQTLIQGDTQYIGCIDGKQCVTATSLEQAIQRLLRRACREAPQ